MSKKDFYLGEDIEMKDMWMNKNFVKLWFGQLISILGDQIHFIALMVLIQNYFGNIVVTGTVMMITAIPKVLFSPFAGVFIDRWSLKKTMIISDILRMLLVLFIPLLFHFLSKPSMTIIFILTFLISTVSIFFYPAKSASIPTLVDKEHLLAANSISGTTQMVISLLGLLTGAVLVSIIGTTWAFIIDAASFLASALFILMIHFPLEKEKNNMQDNKSSIQYIQELTSGIRYISQDSLLRFIIIFFSSLMLFAGATNVLFFAYIEEVLHMDASSIGYIFSGNMVGMIIGMILLQKLSQKYPKEKLLIWSMLIFSFTILQVSWINNILLLIPIMIVNGLGNGIINVASNTILQEYVEESFRGRVFSVIEAIINSALIISMLPAAWLAKQFGVQTIFLSIGIILFILFLISFKIGNSIFASLYKVKEEIVETNRSVMEGEMVK